MDVKLKRSKDRKVANSLTASGSVRIGNSFGLPAGKAYSCPGATSVCESVCYAGKLEKLYKGVKEALTHNWDLLREADHSTMVYLLDDMVSDFKAESIKWNAPLKFRIHWDGDFFNDTYASAWGVVIDRHPDIQFWVYTRVESAAMILRYLPNLALYFSGDSENTEIAKRLSNLGVKVAMLADTFEDAREALGARAAMCPEQRGQIPLNGACVACAICVKGNANILFSITKR
jgi:hypothetical protein